MNGLTFIFVATAVIAAEAWDIWWLSAAFLAVAVIWEGVLGAQRAAALREASKLPEHEQVID